MSTLKFTKSNFLKSKTGNLIVVNCPSRKDSEYFEGIIVNAEDSKTNTLLHHSKEFRKDKFDLIEPTEVRLILKNK